MSWESVIYCKLEIIVIHVMYAYAVVFVLLQLWRVSESEFQFRTFLGQFLTCDGGDGCSIWATALSPSTSGTFYVERNNNGRVHIKTISGTYLQV